MNLDHLKARCLNSSSDNSHLHDFLLEVIDEVRHLESRVCELESQIKEKDQ